MVIVSQDKKRIINFNRIDYIDINIGNGIYYLGVNFSNSYESFFSIGSYKTEERAKEVLKEITRYYRMYQGIKYCDDKVKVGILQEIDKAGQDAYIYTMPED